MVGAQEKYSVVSAPTPDPAGASSAQATGTTSARASTCQPRIPRRRPTTAISAAAPSSATAIAASPSTEARESTTAATQAAIAGVDEAASHQARLFTIGGSASSPSVSSPGGTPSPVRGGSPAQPQMAPLAAEPTSLAYLASTPRVYRGAGGAQPSRRAASSSSSTSRSRGRAAGSSRIRSPSRTNAIGPPSVASGAMWPMQGPVVPPEKRPSVSSRTSLPSPAPLIAPVTASISRMPGPPLGPS